MKDLACACLLLLTTFVAAQMPLHGRVINPSGSWIRTSETLQHEDSVYVFIITSDGALRLSRSIDGGRTWPVLEQTIASAYIPGTSGYQFYNEPLRAYVGAAGELFVSVLTPGEQREVLRSTDGGATWSTCTIPFQPLWQKQDLQLHLDGANVLAVWRRSYGYHDQIWTSRSTDGGNSWSVATRLDAGPSWANGVADTRLFVVGDGANIRVFWSFYRAYYNLGELFRQETNDGGQTWAPAPLSVFADSVRDLAGEGGEMVAVSGGLLRSTDFGVSWNAVPLPVPATIFSVAMEGQRACFTALAGAHPDYLVGASTDGGATWATQTWQSSNALGHEILRSFVEGDVFYSWFGDAEILYSADGGGSWGEMPGFVSYGFSPGDRRNVHVSRTFAPNNDVWAFVGAGYTVLGQGTSGTGGQVAALSTRGLTLQSEVFEFVVDSVLTGSVGVIGVTPPTSAFQPPTSMPFGSGVLWVTASPVLVSFATNASGGSVPVTVPVDASLVGTGMTCQALVLDGGAANGFVLSNGIEVWLR